ncbi:MAG: hypothetical protein AB7H43_05990 [Acidimicrobiia bacterium]
MDERFRSDGLHPVQAIAVLRRPEDLDIARAQLTRAGVLESDVRVDDEQDGVTSVRAEMRSELEHGVIGPQAGMAWTKEGMKGILTVGVPASVVIAALAVPLMIWAAPDFARWVQLGLALTIGVMAGGTIGIVAGGVAARGPAEPLAAEVGYTLRVGAAGPEVLAILESLDPIRVDLVGSDGTPTGDAVVEAPDHSIELTRHRLLHQTDTEWADTDEQRRSREEPGS